MSNNNQKITLPIKGMHCKSCEILIEENLSEVKGVERARADWRHSLVEVYYQGEDKPSMDKIDEAVGKAGYSLGQDDAPKGFVSSKKADWRDLGIAALFLLGIYFLLKGLGITNLNFNTAADTLTVPVVMLVGLTAGFSTCMAMVGGLVLGISAKHAAKHPEATPAEKMRPHIFFNLGRIAAFALLGGILGMVGSVFQLSGLTLGALTLVVGVVMLIMGLQLIGIFPWADKLKLTLPKSLSQALGLGQHQKEYNHRGAMIMGALTFFLPCGFTQAMQVYAVSTGSFTGGALVMGAFAIGTLPGMLSIGGLTSVMKGVFAKRFFKLAGLAVLVFALININNGLNLTGWSNLVQAKTNNTVNVSDPNVTVENGVQVVKMRETATGYVPNKFTIQAGVPVRWVITAEEPYSCAATILLNKYNIRKTLTAGDNVIEFTPTDSGQAPFSCSMGMYRGVFNVVDANTQSNNSAGSATAQTAASPASCNINANPSAPAGGGCGGGSTGGGCGCGGGGKPYVPTTAQILKQVQDDKTRVQADKVKEQVIASNFTYSQDVQPNTFTVKAGVPVRYTVNPSEDGRGCMSTIMIQGLYPNPVLIRAGQPIVMAFTPTTPGSYLITCAMNVPRGKIIVQ